ncbi:transmembrane protein [Thraustotheca clavata]|uniref:Transmembrane protein n=1 Tax=Thraustotheca clavata TaxID=74557 RepID=A0A1V9ZSC4_9STRA|nr:transmembrane protein [Thraustotheca clavata]
MTLSTLTWWCANTFLRMTPPGSGGLASDNFFVEQFVEWQYAFDIHCNAFFVLFLIVHVLQFLLVPLLLGDSFLSLAIANTVYAIGCGSYFYITFLGYMALPFLHNTERFLFPVIAVGGLYLSTLVLSLFLGANFNFAAMSAAYYYST